MEDGIYHCKDFPHRDLGATEETEKAEVPGDCRCMRPYFNSSLGTIKTAVFILIYIQKKIISNYLLEGKVLKHISEQAFWIK